MLALGVRAACHFMGCSPSATRNGAAVQARLAHVGEGVGKQAVFNSWRGNGLGAHNAGDLLNPDEASLAFLPPHGQVGHGRLPGPQQRVAIFFFYSSIAS
jgi:hypothetical protein